MFCTAGSIHLRIKALDASLPELRFASRGPPPCAGCPGLGYRERDDRVLDEIMVYPSPLWPLTPEPRRADESRARNSLDRGNKNGVSSQMGPDGLTRRGAPVGEGRVVGRALSYSACASGQRRVRFASP